LNATELSQGAYPFPADAIIAHTGRPNKSFPDGVFVDVRQVKKKRCANKSSYQIYPDGHLEDFLKTASFASIDEMYHGLFLFTWGNTPALYCGLGQTELAKDPESAIYREEDGSNPIPSSHSS
jgi:hypothetical protein